MQFLLVRRVERHVSLVNPNPKPPKYHPHRVAILVGPPNPAQASEIHDDSVPGAGQTNRTRNIGREQRNPKFRVGLFLARFELTRQMGLRLFDAIRGFEEAAELLDLSLEGIAGGPNRFEGGVELGERARTGPF